MRRKTKGNQARIHTKTLRVASKYQWSAASGSCNDDDDDLFLLCADEDDDDIEEEEGDDMKPPARLTRISDMTRPRKVVSPVAMGVSHEDTKQQAHHKKPNTSEARYHAASTAPSPCCPSGSMDDGAPPPPPPPPPPLRGCKSMPKALLPNRERRRVLAHLRRVDGSRVVGVPVTNEASEWPNKFHATT
jgi:hypothetical protein